jgi:hypothetical protein
MRNRQPSFAKKTTPTGKTPAKSKKANESEKNGWFDKFKNWLSEFI